MINKKDNIIYAGIFVACAFSCFLFMPFKLPGYSFLFERFSVLFFVSLIIAGSLLSPEKIHRWDKGNAVPVVPYSFYIMG